MLAAMAALVAVMAVPAIADAASATKTRTVRYGPFVVPGAMGSMPGMTMPGDMGAMKNFFVPNAAKPCGDCSLTSLKASLSYKSGRIANWNTDAMLHHMVIFNAARRDLTCPTWPERFFASGNERGTQSLPSGYGYGVGGADRWRVLVELMNMATMPQKLYVSVKYTYTRAKVRKARPLWFDINNCSSSEYSVPKGRSDTHRDFVSPLSGKLIAIRGHVHDGGVATALTTPSRRSPICTSRAGYGSRRGPYRGHISSMTGCRRAAGVARLKSGQALRLHSRYNAKTARDDVMGIMVGYVARGG